MEIHVSTQASIVSVAAAKAYIALGAKRLVLARELTKKFEEFLRGTLEEAVEWANNNEIRGEFCLVLEGNKEADELFDEAPYWQDFTLEQHVDYIMSELGQSSKDAIKEVATLRGMQKRDVYNAYHQ